MWFNYGILNNFLKEWTLRKEELKSGKITRDEYFEWKINWPQTCDDCGKREPSKQYPAGHNDRNIFLIPLFVFLFAVDNLPDLSYIVLVGQEKTKAIYVPSYEMARFFEGIFHVYSIDRGHKAFYLHI